MASWTFVGRARERDELRAAAAAAGAGRGGVVLVAGEPGIGKTRLVRELAHDARATGLAVGWGACPPHAAPALSPWAEALAGLAADAAVGGVFAAASPRDDLAMLLATAGAAHDQEPGIDRSEGRLALFHAAARLLRTAAACRPLLLVLDDLHDADLATLRLLEFLAPVVAFEPVLLIATYREADLRRAPERAEILDRVARGGSRLYLAGLAEAECGLLIESLTGRPMPPAVVETLHGGSAGNPFFLHELVQWLIANRGLDAQLSQERIESRLPASVRQLIRARLAPLSRRCRSVLDAAAVLGARFDLASLERAAELDGSESSAGVLEAEEAGLVEASDSGTERGYAFLHPLIRAVVYSDLAPAARRVLHLRAGEDLLARHPDAVDASAAEVARHLLAALPLGSAERAAAAGLRAAHYAARCFAHDEAEQALAPALAALDQANAPPNGLRLAILLALAEARTGLGSGDPRPTFLAAAALAQRLGDQTALERAALGYADSGLGAPTANAVDTEAVRLLETALAAAPAGDSRARVRLLARLATDLCFADDRDRALALSVESVDVARRLGDAGALAYALHSRHFLLWRRNDPAPCYPIALEIAALAERGGDPFLAAHARMWKIHDLMQLGEVEALEREVRDYARQADGLRQARHRWLAINFDAALALWQGRWADAEARAAESAEVGRGLVDPMVVGAPLVQRFLARRERRALADDEPALRAIADRAASPVPRALLAVLLSDLGRDDEAGAEFDRLAAQEFDDLRRELRIGIIPFLAELCVLRGDRSRARTLYELLLPLEPYIVTMGGAACVGAASHHLGMLAGVMGAAADATRHFETALRRHAAMRCEPWLARTGYEYARFLRARGASDRARALLAESGEIAARLGMTALAGRVEQASDAALPAALAAVESVGGGRPISGPRGRVVPLRGGRSGARPPAPAPDRPAEPAPSAAARTLFRCEGEYWSVGCGDRLTRVKDSKGMRHLARLLANPGVEFHVLDLTAAEPAAAPGPRQAAARDGLSVRRDLGDAGEFLDARALAEYRRRAADLREQLAEAEAWNDPARADALRAEVEQIATELARATGMDGRSRRAADHAERARVNVARAVKAAVQRIGRADQALARYLETTVKTGWMCRYTPDDRLPIHWSF